MAMKELLYRLQPVQIYIVLTLSILYFLMQLFLSHITHALTLLVASYHMLCNIVALSGCIMTIKVSFFCSFLSLFLQQIGQLKRAKKSIGILTDIYLVSLSLAL